MTANKLTSNSAVSLTLVEGNGNTDDSLDTNGFALAPASGKIPVTLTLANAPAAGGIVINNSGTITSTAARVIDVGTGANASVTATGAKVTLNNSGTITATGAGKGDLFRVNFDMPQGTVIVNNTGTMKTTVNSNDSQGVRLGKVYSASQITITNGSATASAATNANALIQTNDADAIRPGGVNPTDSNTAFGSSVIVNYGKIIAQNFDGGTLNAVNAIDISQGQSANVDNFGTITGDESGLGADVGYNGPPNFSATSPNLTFVANYIVTNEIGGTITGNNGPAIASGTATIVNAGTVIGKATGVASANSSVTVSNANGTGILTSGAATITNNATGVIQGSGSSGSAATSDAININSGTITNRGTIQETATSGGKGGAAVLFSGSAGSTLNNYGTISSAASLAVTMGGGNDTINLYTGGTITGAIDGGIGSDLLTLNMASGGAATGTLSGVVNVETLTVSSGGWTVTDSETYTSGATIASGATLTIGPNGAISASVVDNGTLIYTEIGTATKAEVISGSGKVVQAGTGTLVLSNGANSYSGGTSLNSGTLDVTTVGAAGTGAITFAAGAQTLDIEQAALAANGGFGDTLAGIGVGDTIDLRGIGAATGTSFNASTNKLTVSGGSETVTLQLDGAAPAGYGYGVASDSNGGTLVALDQKATIQSIATSPASGYATVGSSITITLTTSKAVVISGPNPVLNLVGGGSATFTGIDSTGTKLTFTDIVASGQDADGVQIASITNAAAIQDSFHLAADLSGAVNQTPTGPVIDTTAPQVAITSNAGLTNQATQIVSGTVDVGDNNTTVTIYETYNGTTNAIGSTNVANGHFATQVNLSSGNGNHVIYAADTDAAGNTGTSASVSYDLETTAPPVTVTSAGGLTNQPTQTIVGKVDVSADPEGANSTVTVTDTTTGKVLNTGTTDANGNFSVGVTLVGEGSHALQITDTDQAQNSGSTSVSYTLDTTPPAAPAVTLTHDTGPSSSDGVTNDPSLTYSASATGDTLLYKVDNGSYSTTSPTFATDGTADGTHTISVEEQDPAGNISAATSLTFTLDTTAPTTVPTFGLANDTGSSNSDGITRDPTSKATAGTSGDTLLYKADAAATYTTAAPVFATNGSQDGTHTVSVAEEDAAGNIGPASSVTFTLDTQAPTAPTAVLANDTGTSATDGITSNPSIAYTPSASGDTLLFKADGATSYSTTAPSFATDGSADGSHTMSVVERDAAGNVSAASGLTFTLDTTPPDVDFTSLGGNVNNATQVVNGTVGIEDAGTTVSIYEDGGTTPVASATVNANGFFSATVALGANGQHTLTATDTDAAGNVGTTDTSLTYNVDTTAPTFTAGNLVISISGDGDGSGDYDDNQATPLVLQQIMTDGTYVSQIVLPQTTTTVNGVTESVISAEYGSSSEGSLQLSGDGHSLVIAGYGINAQTYNAGGAAVYGNAALAQSTSIQGGPFTAVPRVIAQINANGSIDTSTSLYNVFNTNNPRSVATIDGTTYYVSGQGVKGDKTQGLYYVRDGGTTATAIDQSTDTRTVEIYNGQLYVSRDSKQGSGGTSNIAVYGSTLPTSATAGAILPGISQTVTLNGSNGNTINGSTAGSSVSLDPNNFFFANLTTLYVADGGIPKQGGAGDGGLQKWAFDGTKWNLQYTLSQGLNVAPLGAAAGTTGLIGLTGRVDANGIVELYATNQTVGDTDQKYVFGIQDQLTATTAAAGESFTTLVTAAPDTNIRGISFAPTALTPTVALTHDTGASATDNVTSDATLTIVKARGSDSLLYSLNGGAYSAAAPSFTSDGSYTISVEEKDTSGNVGPASSLTFTLDTQAPNAPAAPSLTNDTGASTSDMITSDATIAYATPASGGSLLYATDGTTYSTTAPTFTADGTYTVTTKEEDSAGNVSASSILTFTLDTTPPSTPTAPTLTAASDSGSSPTDGITNVSTPTLTGTAEAGSTVTLLDGTTIVGTAIASSAGAYSIVSSSLGNGSHALTVTATDSAGNTSPASTAKTVVIDTTAPSTPATPTLTGVSDTGSSASDGITSDATPTVTGTAEAGSTVTLLDANGAVLGTAVASSSGAYSVTSVALADGSHTLAVTATDAAGNISQASSGRAIVIDTTAPSTPAAPTLTAASDTGISSTDGITQVAKPTVTGTAEAGAAIALYDGTTKVGSAVANSAGTYSIVPSTLGSGSHTLTVTATDTAGNVSAVSPGKVVVIDTTAPAKPAAPTLSPASDTGSSNSDGITNDTKPTFTGTAEAGSIVTLLDGTATVGTALAGTDGTYSITSSTLSSKSHSLTVTATDAAGNVSPASATVTIVVDAVTPFKPGTPMLAAVSDKGSSSTDGITNVKTPLVTGTAEAKAPVTLYDGMTIIGTGTASSSGVYSITTSPLADGSHSLTATATDVAGNVSAASVARTVVIDTRPPATPTAPTLTAASDTGVSSTDGITKATKPTLTGTAEAGSTVTLYDGTTKIGSAVANSSGAYSIVSTATLASGSHTLTVTATDTAGNVSAASAAKIVVIDTTAPAKPAAPTLNAASNSGSTPDNITNVPTPTVSGTAEAGSTITLLDGTTKVGFAVAGANGAYSITASTLTSKSHSLTVTVTDTAGNVSAASAPLTLVVDTAPPSRPSSLSLAAGSDTGSSATDGITSDTTPTVTGTAEASSSVTLFDGTTVLGTGTASSSGAYSITSSVLGAGSHSLTVKATDAAGNVSAASAAKTVVIDTTAPAVAITRSGGAVTTASQTVAGSGEVGSIVTLADNGAAIGKALTVGSAGTWSEAITLSSGSNAIVATGTDKAGNAGTSNSVTYTLGTTPAAVAAATPSASSAASMNSLVQAMATMTPAPAATMTPTTPPPAAPEASLAPAH